MIFICDENYGKYTTVSQEILEYYTVYCSPYKALRLALRIMSMVNIAIGLTDNAVYCKHCHRRSSGVAAKSKALRSRGTSNSSNRCV